MVVFPKLRSLIVFPVEYGALLEDEEIEDFVPPSPQIVEEEEEDVEEEEEEEEGEDEDEAEDAEVKEDDEEEKEEEEEDESGESSFPPLRQRLGMSDAELPPPPKRPRQALKVALQSFRF